MTETKTFSTNRIAKYFDETTENKIGNIKKIVIFFLTKNASVCDNALNVNRLTVRKNAMDLAFNPYAFCNNNPWRYKDPEGKWVIDYVDHVATTENGDNLKTLAKEIFDDESQWNTFISQKTKKNPKNSTDLSVDEKFDFDASVKPKTYIIIGDVSDENVPIPGLSILSKSFFSYSYNFTNKFKMLAIFIEAEEKSKGNRVKILPAQPTRKQFIEALKLAGNLYITSHSVTMSPGYLKKRNDFKGGIYDVFHDPIILGIKINETDILNLPEIKNITTKKKFSTVDLGVCYPNLFKNYFDAKNYNCNASGQTLFFSHMLRWINAGF